MSNAARTADRCAARRGRKPDRQPVSAESTGFMVSFESSQRDWRVMRAVVNNEGRIVLCERRRHRSSGSVCSHAGTICRARDEPLAAVSDEHAARIILMRWVAGRCGRILRFVRSRRELTENLFGHALDAAQHGLSDPLNGSTVTDRRVVGFGSPRGTGMFTLEGSGVPPASLDRDLKRR